MNKCIFSILSLFFVVLVADSALAQVVSEDITGTSIAEPTPTPLAPAVLPSAPKSVSTSADNSVSAPADASVSSADQSTAAEEKTASAEKPSEKPAKKTQLGEENPDERWIFGAHKKIAKYFDDVADSFDQFLIGKRLTKQPNGTRVEINGAVYFPEGSSAYTTTDINVNLRLPNFEKYWQLKFTNYDDQQSQRGVRRTYLRQGRSADEEKNYGASLGFFSQFDKVKVTFQPRINLGGGLHVAQSLVLQSSLDKETVKFKPKLEFFATPEKGTGIFGGFNNEIQLSETYSLSVVNEGEYQEQDNIFIATQGLSLGRNIDDISSISYGLFFISNNRPSYHLESFNISTGYHVIVYKDFIEVGASTGLDFQKGYGFKGVGLTAFSFSLIF